MLIDEATITVIAGPGGSGHVAFYNGRGKPCGGDGGQGGHIYADVKPQLSSLYTYLERKEYKSDRGEDGGSFNCAGKDTPPMTLYFPAGTVLTDLETGEEIDLSSVQLPYLLCKGGHGGWGNSHFNLANNALFDRANDGRHGETRRFKVIMRLIADAGLIGFPNAGKSSLLNVLTAAHVRVADYPFTTLEPNLGVLYGNSGYTRVVLADIPGLIEGASEGKGLGHKFLKHIEKVSLLLHCISSESDDPLRDYKQIRTELGAYNPALLEKKELIIFTKSDLWTDPKKDEKRLLNDLKSIKHEKICVSIADDESLSNLAEMVVSALKK